MKIIILAEKGEKPEIQISIHSREDLELFNDIDWNLEDFFKYLTKRCLDEGTH
jgi:hypothetical protein